MMLTTDHFSRHSGFSLVELTVVLTIVAVLMVGAGKLVLIKAKQQELSETQRELQDIRLALRGYIAIYGRLPCPDNDRIRNTAEFGVEDRHNGDCLSAEGWFPFASVGGVGRTDAWGNRFRYRVVAELARTPSSAPQTFLSVCEGNALAGACGQPVALELAAVILSHGRNSLGARNYADRLQSWPDAGHLHERENADGRSEDDNEVNQAPQSSLFISHERREFAGAGGEFDDIVAWLPFSVFQATLLAR